MAPASGNGGFQGHGGSHRHGGSIGTAGPMGISGFSSARHSGLHRIRIAGGPKDLRAVPRGRYAVSVLSQTAMDSGTTSTVAGTAIGAAARALIGAAAGEPAGGAAIGAGSGLLLGSAAGPGATGALPTPCRTATTSPTYNACTRRETRCRPPQHIGMHFGAISPRRRYRTGGAPPPVPPGAKPPLPTRRTATAQQSVKRILTP